MCFKRQIYIERVVRRKYFTSDGYIIKAVTNGFHIEESCAYYSNYVSLIQDYVKPLHPRSKTVNNDTLIMKIHP